MPTGAAANLRYSRGAYRGTTGQGTSTIIADLIDGGLAAKGGDSGGPVYANKTTKEVYAVGMIQAVDSKLSCAVYYTSTNTIIGSVPNSALYWGQPLQQRRRANTTSVFGSHVHIAALAAPTSGYGIAAPNETYQLTETIATIVANRARPIEGTT